jgi:cytochrome c553
VRWLAVVVLLAGRVGAEAPAWAWPSCVKPAPPTVLDVPLTVPGSTRTFTLGQLRDPTRVSDWFPAEHDPLPEVIARAAPGHYACGFCHLPDGSGRAENARIAGLPAAYIVGQVKALLAHQRVGPPGFLPTAAMVTSVEGLSDDELERAADWFSRQRPPKRLTVVEAATAPDAAPLCWVFTPVPSPLKAIVELPLDRERFELRDPHVPWVATVPVGSIVRGRALAAGQDGGPQASCESCHGPGLRGDRSLPGPPLAGRFPLYLFRQLLQFQSGARHAGNAVVMQPVVAGRTEQDLVDLAAYAASLDP